MTWSGSWWRPDSTSDDALFYAVATLLDAKGRELDRSSQRTAVRAFDHRDDALALNGEQFPLLAVRADLMRAPHQQLARLPGTHVNSLEVHGRMPPAPWLREADELGLPVVVLPRCDARLWQHGGLPPEQRIRSAEEILGQQDHALVWGAAQHPALVLWACEGSLGVSREMCRRLSELDPRDTPAAGFDIPSRSADASRDAEANPLAGPMAGGQMGHGWVVEIMGARDDTPPSRAAAAFLEAAGSSGFGGVANSPPLSRKGRDDWAASWAEVAQQLEVRPLTASETRRSGAQVVVQGLTPGDTAWLEIPGLSTVGSVAGSDGTATLEAWHRGAAVVVAGSQRWDVTLEPDSWVRLARISAAVVLTAGGAPP